MTYISWSNNFVFYLQDYLMNESYFQIMRQCDPNFDIKINVGQHLLNIFQDYLMDEHHGIMDQCDTKIDIIRCIT